MKTNKEEMRVELSDHRHKTKTVKERRKNEEEKEPQYVESPHEEKNLEHSEEDLLLVKKSDNIGPKKKRNKIRVLKGFIVSSEITMIVMLCLFWDSMNAFEIIYSNTWSVIGKSLLLLLTVVGYIFRYYRLHRMQNYFLNPTKSMAIKITIIGSVVIVIVFGNWGMMTLIKGLCIGNHNSDASGMTIGSWTFTTAVSRHWGTSTGPNNKQPCLVYATLPEDALTGVFINFHINPASGSGKCNPKLLLSIPANPSDAHDMQEWIELPAVKGAYKLPPHEYESREMYTVLLKTLEENKLYSFKISQEGWDKLPVYTYKSFNTQKMVIINGGDIGNNKVANLINKNVVAKQDPDLIFVGGDISYDNGFPECYQGYDNVLLRLPYQKYDAASDTTRIVPVMFTTGNHDFGVNAYSGHKIKHDDTQPIFKHYYPQNTNPSGEIPDVNQRKSYFSHSIGDRILFLSLDTGYAADIAGEQTEWLEAELKKKNYELIFAQYHNPIYSACTKGNKGQPVTEAKKYWVPLFDKYGLTMGFENHVHGFKRTKRIKNGTPDSNGAVYIGDGSWGPLVHSGDKVNQDIMVKDGLWNHVWIIEIGATKVIQATAYNENGDVIDSFQHNAT